MRLKIVVIKVSKYYVFNLDSGIGSRPVAERKRIKAKIAQPGEAKRHNSKQPTRSNKTIE